MKIKILLISVFAAFSMQKTFSQQEEFKNLEITDSSDSSLLLERVNQRNKEYKYALSLFVSYYTKEEFKKNEPAEKAQYTYYKDGNFRTKRRIYLAKKGPYSSEYAKLGYTKYKYDDSYRLIEEHVYGKAYHKKKIKYRHDKKENFSYYDNDKLKEYVMYFWDVDFDKWKQHRKFTYEYDEEGKVTQAKEYWSNREGTGWVYLFADVHSYNKKGQLTEVVRKASKNKVLNKRLFKYSNTGFLIKMLNYKGNSGYPNYVIEYRIKDNHVLETLSYDFQSGKKIPNYRIEIEYDKSLDSKEVLIPYYELEFLGYSRANKEGYKNKKHPISSRKVYWWDRLANKWEENHSLHLYNYKSLLDDKNLSIDEVTKVNNYYNVKLSGNPVSNFLKLTWNTDKASVIDNIEIYDTSGAIVIKSPSIKYGESIPVENLSSGVYFINYKIDNKLGRIKMIKK